MFGSRLSRAESLALTDIAVTARMDSTTITT